MTKFYEIFSKFGAFYSRDMMKALVILLCLTFVAAKGVDINLDTDKTGWVDILNPFGGELVNNHEVQQNCDVDEQVRACQKKIEQLLVENNLLRSQRSDTVDVLLKHILRQFLLKLDVDMSTCLEINKNARVYLSADDVSTLREYLNSQKHLEEVNLRERLRDALEGFVVAEESEESGILLFVRKYLPYLIILNLIFLPLACYNVLRRVIGLRQMLGFFLVATFSMSYYFTYIRKYQEVLATRFSRLDHSNEICSPKGLVSEALDVLLSYVRIKGKDQCLQKYEDMLVEPFLLVDPLQVFGEVVTNFLMSPFSVIGIHLNRFFNDFFIDTPIFLAAVKLIFIILVLFYLSGYRIRTLIATIEPSDTVRQTYLSMRESVVGTHEQRPFIANVQYQRLEGRDRHHHTIAEGLHYDSIDAHSDSSDLPIFHMDDSNVTRRTPRAKPQRSKSLPRTYAITASV